MKFLKSLVLAMLLTLFYGQAYALDASVVNMEEGQTVTGVIVDQHETHDDCKKPWIRVPGINETIGVLAGMLGHGSVFSGSEGRYLDEKRATALLITIKDDSGKGYYAQASDKSLQVGEKVEATYKGKGCFDVKVLARAKAESKDDTTRPNGNEVVSQPDTRN